MKATRLYTLLAMLMMSIQIIGQERTVVQGFCKDESEFKLTLYKGEYLLRFDDGKAYKHATITVK